MSLLTVEGLTKSFGGFTALSDVSLTVSQGERLGLIGPNGSGKTTLVNCISGFLRPEHGVMRFLGVDLCKLPGHQRIRFGIARSFQIPRPFSSMSVIENLYIPLEYVVHSRSLKARGMREDAMVLLRQFGLADKCDVRADTLSQVELRKLELARAMAARPKLLISDESMAGLSSAEVDEVLDILGKVSQAGVTVIMIEHIMRAIMRFSERILCLDAGRIIAEGSPQEIREHAAVQRAYLGA